MYLEVLNLVEGSCNDNCGIGFSTWFWQSPRHTRTNLNLVLVRVL
eukprot:SAG31_NODE_39325_length_289_cov_0.810526_1_plen_44_part_01